MESIIVTVGCWVFNHVVTPPYIYGWLGALLILLGLLFARNKEFMSIAEREKIRANFFEELANIKCSGHSWDEAVEKELTDEEFKNLPQKYFFLTFYWKERKTWLLQNPKRLDVILDWSSSSRYFWKPCEFYNEFLEVVGKYTNVPRYPVKLAHKRAYKGHKNRCVVEYNKGIDPKTEITGRKLIFPLYYREPHPEKCKCEYCKATWTRPLCPHCNEIVEHPIIFSRHEEGKAGSVPADSGCLPHPFNVKISELYSNAILDRIGAQFFQDEPCPSCNTSLTVGWTRMGYRFIKKPQQTLGLLIKVARIVPSVVIFRLVMNIGKICYKYYVWRYKPATVCYLKSLFVGWVFEVPEDISSKLLEAFSEKKLGTGYYYYFKNYAGRAQVEIDRRKENKRD